MKSLLKIVLFALPTILIANAVTTANLRPGPRVAVTFFLGTECPVSAGYTSRINGLVRDFSKRGVEFRAKFPQASDDASMMTKFAKERKLELPCAIDSGGKSALVSAVKVVPTVIVQNTNGQTLYIGSIDDNSNTSLVKHRYLRDALGQVLSGQPVTVRETTPTGCVLSPGSTPPPMKPVDYSSDVAKIFNDHCVSCHRPGEVAPFSLIGYQNAKNWAPTIALVTKSRKMPPWKAAPGVGEFIHENRLTEEEIATLKEWADNGAPRGDAKKEPKAPTFKPGWAIGEPDMVLQMDKPFKISADGQDEYWHFILKPKNTEPIFVQAVDVRPGNKKIVHHVILWIDEKGAADKVLAQKGVNGAYLTFGSPGFIPDNSLGGWAPGMMPTRTPSDAGFLLKPGASIVLEIHYHKSGKEEFDQTKIGLYLAKDSKKVTSPLEIAWLANPFIKIKAGLANQKFTQTIPIPVDVKLYSLMPHMHLLGREMVAILVHPDGKEERLIQVDDWDFNWQFTYGLKQPKLIKKGSKIRIEAVYDNSSNNPNNPSDPPREVRWGEETTDEMMLLVAAINIPNRGKFRGGIGF